MRDVDRAIAGDRGAVVLDGCLWGCAAVAVAGAGAQWWCWGQLVRLDPDVTFTERW